MNLLEYQAKEILGTFGVRMPKAITIDDKAGLAKITAAKFKTGFVVKAQVAAGGRGKAGGVKITDKVAEAKTAAKAMLGAALSTKQTAGGAVAIKAVMIAEKVKIEKELYMAVVLNRKKACPMLLLSARGGMDIEEVAKTDPGAIFEIPVDPVTGVHSFVLRDAASSKLGIEAKWLNDFVDFATRIVKAYLEREMTMLEINPLALTPQGFMAVDAKVALEENALFRQPGNQKYAKQSYKELGRAEKRAKELGISYIPIGGDIGCLVNGAGLAMATMDMIALNKRQPANFLDVGGGSDAEQTQRAFELLLANGQLSAIFVNIFGGIVRCDIIAEALVKAAARYPLKVPLVARLKGTRMEEARDVLKKADLSHVRVFEELDDAIKAVCEVTPV